MELVVDLKERSYPIIIENGVINRVAEEVSKVYNGRRIFIVTDDNVNKYYGDKVVSSLKNKDFEVKLLSLGPGEKTKNFNTLPTVYDALLDNCIRWRSYWRLNWICSFYIFKGSRLYSNTNITFSTS